MIATYPLPVYVQRFFTERLLTQMRASELFENTRPPLPRSVPPSD